MNRAVAVLVSTASIGFLYQLLKWRAEQKARNENEVIFKDGPIVSSAHDESFFFHILLHLS